MAFTHSHWSPDRSDWRTHQHKQRVKHPKAHPTFGLDHCSFFLYHTFVLFFLSARSVNVQQCLWAKTLIARTETPPTCCSNLQIRINKLKGTIVSKTEELKQLQAEGELRGPGQDIILDYFNLWIMANYSSTVQKKSNMLVKQAKQTTFNFLTCARASEKCPM